MWCFLLEFAFSDSPLPTHHLYKLINVYTQYTQYRYIYISAAIAVSKWCTHWVSIGTVFTFFVRVIISHNSMSKSFKIGQCMEWFRRSMTILKNKIENRLGKWWCEMRSRMFDRVTQKATPLLWSQYKYTGPHHHFSIRGVKYREASTDRYFIPTWVFPERFFESYCRLHPLFRSNHFLDDEEIRKMSRRRRRKTNLSIFTRT